MNLSVLLLASTIVIAPLANVTACTTIVVKATDGTVVTARSMEFAIDFHSRIIAVPRGHTYTGTLPNGGAGLQWKSAYGFVGADGLGLPQVVDGINERGLTFSLLYFPGFADYGTLTEQDKNKALAPWEFGSWVLSSCTSVQDVIDKLSTVRIAPVTHRLVGMVVPAHYSITDTTGRSIVIEPLNGSLKIFENTVGVLTNAPTFDWHLINLSNYVNLQPHDVRSMKLGDVIFERLGKGIGLHGLPGDPTPPSRFVRAALFRNWVLPVHNGEHAVLQAIHLLNPFFIPKGISAASSEATPMYELTQWETFADLTNKKYYYRTYNNQNIRMVDLNKIDFNAAAITAYSMEQPTTYEDVTTKLVPDQL